MFLVLLLYGIHEKRWYNLGIVMISIIALCYIPNLLGEKKEKNLGTHGMIQESYMKILITRTDISKSAVSTLICSMIYMIIYFIPAKMLLYFMKNWMNITIKRNPLMKMSIPGYLQKKM